MFLHVLITTSKTKGKLEGAKTGCKQPQGKILMVGQFNLCLSQNSKCSDDITPEAITLICLIFLILGSLVSGLQAATAQKLNTINNIDYFTALIFFDFAIPQFFNPATGSRIQPYIKINYL